MSASPLSTLGTPALAEDAELHACKMGSLDRFGWAQRIVTSMIGTRQRLEVIGHGAKMKVRLVGDRDGRPLEGF
jgi:hypothetical protein